MSWSFGPVTIKGHLASKSNSRRKTNWGGVIKSQAALDFEDAFAWQLKRQPVAFTGPVALFVWAYYKDRKRDLDVALLQDQIQAGSAEKPKANVIQNDRQIVEIHAKRFVDKENPRVVFELREVTQ